MPVIRNPKFCLLRELEADQKTEARRLAIQERQENASIVEPGAPGAGGTAPSHGRLWRPGRSLRLRFLDGEPSVKDKVERAARLWEQYANIQLLFGDDPQAEIRISFDPLQGAWCYVGTDALAVPRDQPTLNLGWLKPNTPTQEYERLVLHEFGHVLGLVHEHQTPTTDFPWDKPAIYRYFAEGFGWSQEQVDRQFFAKLAPLQTNFGMFDPHSIMLNPVPGEFTLGDFEVGWSTTFSATDKQFIGQAYPFEASYSHPMGFTATPLYGRAAPEPPPKGHTFQFNKSQLTILFGNITRCEAQVLVSSDDSFLSMSGGVSAAILKAGGDAIALDAAKKVPASVGDVVVTTAGLLPAQHIFHAVTLGFGASGMTPEKIIQTTVGRCLELLDALRLKSIAFPAIGAGTARFGYEEVAAVMAQVIADYLLPKEEPIQVTICLFDPLRRMDEVDIGQFFAKFAVRIPGVASHKVETQPDIQPEKPIIAQDVTEGYDADTAQKILRLRQQQSALETSRLKLRDRKIELLASIRPEDAAEREKITRNLQEIEDEILDCKKEEQALRETVMKPKAKAYTDFHLHVLPDGSLRAKSSQGERLGAMRLTLPFEAKAAIKKIEENNTDQKMLEELGKQLHGLLFPSLVHAHLIAAEAVAQENKQKVRIRLTVDPESLAHVPWEFAYREEGGYFLSTNPQTVVTRYLNLPLPANRARRREGALDLLLIIANPSDQDTLDPDEWEQIVSKALEKPVKDGGLRIRTVKRATRREISAALVQQKPDIVQFVGHGIFEGDTNKEGKGYLALVDQVTGDTWKVDDQRFADLFLAASDHLGLVCLATCESAKSDSPRSYRGIAPQIVQKGVPAVVAMQYEIQVAAAKIFLEEFYQAVAARHPVDWAVQWARNQIAVAFGRDNREFATPVLYMRAEDGNIF